MDAKQLMQMSDFWPARVLDIGGGPAVYAEVFCESVPGLSAAQLDLPPVRTEPQR